MSERIEKLVGDMTLDEKAAFVAGIDLWHTGGVERLGVPALKVTDGPGGARGEKWTGHAAACFPCGTALGATISGRVFEASGSVFAVAESWHRGPTAEPTLDPEAIGPMALDLVARARPNADMSGQDKADHLPG